MGRGAGNEKPGLDRRPAAEPSAPNRRTLHKHVVGALRALIGLLESDPPPAPSDTEEKRYVKRSTSDLEGRAWDRAIAELKPTGAVVRPGRENMIERATFEAWVSAQRVGTGEEKGETSDEYDAFVQRARKRRRAKNDIDT